MPSSQWTVNSNSGGHRWLGRSEFHPAFGDVGGAGSPVFRGVCGEDQRVESCCYGWFRESSNGPFERCAGVVIGGAGPPVFRSRPGLSGVAHGECQVTATRLSSVLGRRSGRTVRSMPARSGQGSADAAEERCAGV